MPYYVGDPCYIIRDELWDDFCTKLFAIQNTTSIQNSAITINYFKLLLGSQIVNLDHNRPQI